ncbi:MAG TPA: hypothetical protein VK982_08025, partial [Bacteroidales bacterium]|nr:hypothetical protein [Bacteroidales bacterium]
ICIRKKFRIVYNAIGNIRPGYIHALFVNFSAWMFQLFYEWHKKFSIHSALTAIRHHSLKAGTRINLV